jgi:hypothetical protein
MDSLKPQLNLIQHSTHILRQILQLRTQRAILLLRVRVAIDQHVRLHLVAELTAEIPTHQFEAVLYVPHVETAHQEFLGLLPVVEVLRPAVADYHQDYQPQREEIVSNVRLVRFHHA